MLSLLKCINLNKYMLSLVVHAGYEGSDIAEKNTFFNFFSAMIASLITGRESSMKAFYCL